MKSSHVIRAAWDARAGVWVAVSDDVTGLVTEAETMEVLESKLASMVPELLLANGHPVDSATVRLHCSSMLHLASCFRSSSITLNQQAA